MKGPFLDVRSMKGPFVDLRSMKGPFVDVRSMKGPFMLKPGGRGQLTTSAVALSVPPA
jgi:hypothetical protein